MTNELSLEALIAISKIEKLLNLAAKAGTAAEAASANAKAQELLVKYNLSTENIEGASTADGKREQAAVEGGFYAFERRLWSSVAELNFCVYWCQTYSVKGIRKRYNAGLPPIETMISKKRHVLVGRTVNVRATRVMAAYLAAAVERITNERIKANGIAKVSSWAVTFRDGVVATVVEKLEDRRREALSEERLAEKRRQRATADAQAAGFSTESAVTLAAFSQTEKDANMDFVAGEVGYSARRRAERVAHEQERAKQRAEEEAAYTKWAAENPDEVAKAERDAQRREERNAARRTGRAYSYKEDTKDWGAWREGRKAGEKIGLDGQVNDNKTAARIGRTL